jgi:transposase, IS30 family
MPCLRQTSATGKPDSPSPNIPTIWLSVNFDFLIPHLQRNGSLYFQLVHRLGELTRSAIVDKLQPLAARVKTLTFENGKEFIGHAYIDQQLQRTAYFARPFTSWERGSNENLNGMLRQYVPKKRAMSTVSDEEIRMIQNRLNNRPRKRLGFKTPAEVFHQSLKSVALRT